VQAHGYGNMTTDRVKALLLCRDCGVYTVTDDRARERAITMEIVDKLHRERVSQRGIARVTGISRPTIKRWLRAKDRAPQRGDDPAERDASGDQDR
jgi:DNA invertase Pin-like site-specific DNA recombinase